MESSYFEDPGWMYSYGFKYLLQYYFSLGFPYVKESQTAVLPQV